MEKRRVSAAKVGRAVGGATRQVIQAGGRRVDDWVSVYGQAFRRLAFTQAAAYAGDTLVAVGLAGTIGRNVWSTRPAPRSRAVRNHQRMSSKQEFVT